MKTLNVVKKGVVIGGLAAALLFGGTIPGFGGAVANAAEVNYDKVIENQLSGLAGYVGALSNRTEGEIVLDLQSGKSLTELSGLPGTELYNQLSKSLKQSIDMAAQGDKNITSEQLNKIKSDADKKIAAVLTTGGYELTRQASVDYDKMIERYLGGITGYVGSIANKEESEVSVLLQQGKSLGEISGLGAGELAKKLTASLNQSIDMSAKNDKSITSERLQKIKSEAAARIAGIVEKGGK
jgi:hypothetical protein